MLIELLKRLLEEFYYEIREENWFGKERELVSRFAFTKLVRAVGECEELYSTAQISIETRVKQLKAEGKKEVCKDMIIWNGENQTAWSEHSIPKMIIEWKHGKTIPFLYDVAWLKEYTNVNKECIGITVNIDNKPKYRMHATLIQNGEFVDYNWVLKE